MNLIKGDKVEIKGNSIFEMMGFDKVSGTVIVLSTGGKAFSFKCDQTNCIEGCDFGDGDIQKVG